MHLVLRLDVYTTHYPMAPGGRNENLFLRPANPGESFDWPKDAKGYVISIVTKNTLLDLDLDLDLALPPEPDPYSNGEETVAEDPEPSPIVIDPVAASVAALSANVEKLRHNDQVGRRHHRCHSDVLGWQVARQLD